MSGKNQTSLHGFESQPIPDNACIRFEECENTVPGNGAICGSCLDAARKRDREAAYTQYLNQL